MKLKGISVFTRRAIEVEIEDETISCVTEIKGSLQELPYISPGLLDMQVNGYKGSDYSLEDFSERYVHNIIKSLAVSGATQHVPTFVSVPEKRLVRNLELTSKAINGFEDVKNAIAGIHIEGPFISSEEGPRGAHDRRYIREPDFDEFEEWQEAAEGRIVYVTVAPERKGSIDFIKRVTAAGVCVAIGHTGAEPEEIWKAVDAGAGLSTHLGNGSYTMVPRLRNYIWEQLAADKLIASIISDGFHLPGSVVKVFAGAKGLDHLVLVSDAALFGGFKPGVYKRGDLDIEVFDDEHLGLPGTTILAGAAHLLDWDIAHFMDFTGTSLEETIPLCTTNPAKLIGTHLLPDHYGKLEAGAPANLCLFCYQPGDKRLNVEKTICMGKEIFRKR